MKKLKVGLISLGCDKNRIDSEIILSKLSEGYEITNEENEADIIIVNTCGFIETSKQESINAILEMAKYKTNYSCKVLVATGCLTQRYGSELLELIPELDFILGVNDYDRLKSFIEEKISGNTIETKINYSDSNINEGKRILTTGKQTAYLRISEGCSNNCSYCIIPRIRGKYRSRTKESILKEAEDLVSSGVKELILVAQDTTRYGIDIYNKKVLHELLRDLSKIKGIKWIRILYCYPEEIYDELIDEIANNEIICNYLDIPIQHISNNILRAMRRRTKKEIIKERISAMKERIPSLILRTSIIVGFPGETEEDFQELKDFVKEIKFDKLGVFKYSQEEDTDAAKLGNQIPDEIKEEREKTLMLIQQEVSAEVNTNKIGRVYEVIVEDKDVEYYYGRSFETSPEIDGEVFIKPDRDLKIGEFVKVKIVDSLEYDLIGVVYDESCK
ncbi:30S ribosomal protein S12 methylthiotransferase RimO [Clostridium cellulovorans]|uniref:Ribosomal protein uS12 methylthiotransferase RimO n=1 Tax=Clostridium cellulovorans (strain ATCC 35296 / DSM 3052 / OCM 3 / 743B) TaxID=573061 RepID=D9SMU1_CLOC7|nr:30S ribosomal protein S12 methylthiotransferase RimO [Clostridium cellulovorans]ADL51807.1 MiaB-like tRNA modifying enzyme YliG [Clostridium cellulovorans 743B]